jgi:hypothetical protein
MVERKVWVCPKCSKEYRETSIPLRYPPECSRTLACRGKVMIPKAEGKSAG